MKKQLLLMLIIANIPVIYLATISLTSGLVTAVAVVISILSSWFFRLRLSSHSATYELHQRLSRSVKALVERDLESELFKLSSKEEERIKTDLQEIDTAEESGQKSLNLMVFLPVFIFLLNALILLTINKDLTALGEENTFGMATMLILAHLSCITPAVSPRNS